jgi:WD40 repeat protein
MSTDVEHGGYAAEITPLTLEHPATFDLFISYRRRDAHGIVRNLQRRLVSYRLPAGFDPVRRAKRLSVFWDVRDRQITLDFWNDHLVPALDRSQRVMAIVSPASADADTEERPNWMRRELRHLISSGKAQRLLIARATGQVPLPEELAAVAERAEIVDLDDFGSPFRTWISPGRVRRTVATIAAPLVGVNVNEMAMLLGEEQAIARRQTKIRAAALVLVLIVVSGALLYARDRRVEATRAAAAQMAALSRLLYRTSPDMVGEGALLAAASYDSAPSLDASDLLHQYLSLLRLRAITAPHRGQIRALSWSPESRLVATGGDDGRLRVFETSSGKEVGIAGGHPIRGLTFDPSDGRVIAGRPNGSVTALDVSTGVERPISQHREGVADAAASQDRRWVATAGLDGTAQLIAAGTGKTELTVRHGAPVRRVIFSRDSRFMITASDSAVRVTDLRTRHEERYECEFVYDNIALVGPNDLSAVCKGDVVLLSLSSARPHVRVPHRGDAIADVVGGSDGSFMLTLGRNASAIRMFNARTGEQKNLPSMTGRSIALSPDGSLLAVGEDERLVRLYRTDTWQEMARLPCDCAPWRLAFSPDGRYLAVAGEWNLQVFHVVRTVPIQRYNAFDFAFASATAFKPGTNEFAIGSPSGVRVADWRTGKITLLSSAGPPISLAFCPDGRLLSVSAGRDDQPARVADIYDPTWSREIAPSRGVVTAAFTRDCRLVAVGGYARQVHIFDLSGAKEVAQFEHDEAIRTVVFNPDGRRLAAAGSFRVAVFDVSEQRVTARATELGDSIAFTADGTGIVNSLGVFSLASGDYAVRFGLGGWAAYSVEANAVAVGNSDSGVVNIFDAGSGIPLTQLHFPAPIREVGFSPDGRLLSVAGARQTDVTLWKPADLLQGVCTHLPPFAPRLSEVMTNEPYPRNCDQFRKTPPMSGEGIPFVMPEL